MRFSTVDKFWIQMALNQEHWVQIRKMTLEVFFSYKQRNQLSLF